jgi:hypothetical protein|tara:strand:- start:172 stop:384 length:213 start_codon:yes stop_codon:yes gene_type:complete
MKSLLLLFKIFGYGFLILCIHGETGNYTAFFSFLVIVILEYQTAVQTKHYKQWIQTMAFLKIVNNKIEGR